MCFDVSTHISHQKRFQPNIIINKNWSSCKVPVIFVIFHETLILFTYFRKNIKFRENPSSGNKVFLCRRTDGQADVSKLTVAFHNFSYSSKMRYYLLYLFCKLGNWHKIVYSIYGSTNSNGTWHILVWSVPVYPGHSRLLVFKFFVPMC